MEDQFGGMSANKTAENKLLRALIRGLFGILGAVMTRAGRCHVHLFSAHLDVVVRVRRGKLRASKKKQKNREVPHIIICHTFHGSVEARGSHMEVKIGSLEARGMPWKLSRTSTEVLS